MGIDYLERPSTHYVECCFGVPTCVYNIKGNVMGTTKENVKTIDADDLLAFLINIANEAKKGYYEDNTDWIYGYCAAVEDIKERFIVDE
jgi:hypothetical protein